MDQQQVETRVVEIANINNSGTPYTLSTTWGSPLDTVELIMKFEEEWDSLEGTLQEASAGWSTLQDAANHIFNNL